MRKLSEMTPDEVCETYFRLKAKITVQKMTGDHNFRDFVLVEGDRNALEFLGNLLHAQSRYKKDCSFFIGPSSAGHGTFSRQSTLGLYIHRLPCMEKRGLRLAVDPGKGRRRSSKRR